MIKIWWLSIYMRPGHMYLYMCNNRYLLFRPNANLTRWLCTIPEKPELVSIVSKLGDRWPWCVDPVSETNRETVFNKVYEELTLEMQSAEHRSNKVWIEWPHLTLN